VYAMQYDIGLPADYDMAIIRERVASKGHLLDGLGGLSVKAYLLRERGDYSSSNAYAPFYLWQDTTAMLKFLCGGGGFSGIVQSFGRPCVRTWLGAGFKFGSDEEPAAKWATRMTGASRPGEDPSVLAEELNGWLDCTLQTSGAQSALVGVDPATWETVKFALWAERPQLAPDTVVYEVLHVSRPPQTGSGEV
jgi:hypothetical protein